MKIRIICLLFLTAHSLTYSMVKINKKKNHPKKNYNYALKVLLDHSSSSPVHCNYLHNALEHLKLQCINPDAQCKCIITRKLLKEFKLVDSKGKILPAIKQQLTDIAPL